MSEIHELLSCQRETLDLAREVKSGVGDLRERVAALEQRSSVHPETRGAPDPVAAIARTIAKDERFQALLKRSAREYGATFNLHDVLFARKAAIVTSDDTAQPQRVPGAVAIDPGRTSWVRDLIPIGIAGAANVEFVRETNARQDAAPQYSGTSPAQTEAVAKNEASFTFSAVTVPVVTLAHWAQTSRQLAADVPELTAFVGNALLAGVMHALESNIIAGDGTSGKMSGLLASGNFTAASGLSTSDNQLDYLRRAIAQLQATNHQPDAILLNPADHATVEILRESSGPYLAGDPRGQSQPTLWGVPVYVSPAVTSGSYIVAALQQATRLWVREEAVLRVSDAHAETFTANVLTWLAEARFAFAVTRTTGVIVGSF